VAPPNLISTALSTTNEPLGGTTDGEELPRAKTFDLVCLDRFARCRVELHHIMPIAKKNAGYGDRCASVCRRSTKLLTAALIMHLPVHQAIQSRP
jgi:hypothetical protein